MEAAVEVEVAMTTIGYCSGDDVDLELEDDELSIGAEVTCDDSDGGGGGGGVSILEELLKAENGNGEALACLQVNMHIQRFSPYYNVSIHSRKRKKRKYELRAALA